MHSDGYGKQLSPIEFQNKYDGLKYKGKSWRTFSHLDGNFTLEDGSKVSRAEFDQYHSTYNSLDDKRGTFKGVYNSAKGYYSLPAGTPIDNMKLNASGTWDPKHYGVDYGPKPTTSQSDDPCAYSCDWKVYDSGFTRFEYCARPGCKKERPI